MARSVVVTHDGDDDTPVTSAAEEPVTLKALLENLGRDVIQVATAPLGLDVPPGEPVIYDAAELSALTRDSVVLAVGADTAGPRGASPSPESSCGGGTVPTSFLLRGSRTADAQILSVVATSGGDRFRGG